MAIKTFKNILNYFILMSLVLLTGCSTVNYSKVSYQYMAPPEYQLTDKHKTIAFTLEGMEKDRRFEKTGVEVPGLETISNDKESDIVVDIVLSESEIRYGKVNRHERVVVFGKNAGQTFFVFDQDGKIVTPYSISIFDRVNNNYVNKINSYYTTKISSGEQANVYLAKAKLEKEKTNRLNKHRSNSMIMVMSDLERSVKTKFSSHKKSTTYKFPKRADNNLKISEAFNILRKEPNKTGAKKALDIYLSIGMNNYDKDGKPDEDLNKAIRSGIDNANKIINHKYDPA